MPRPDLAMSLNLCLIYWYDTSWDSRRDFPKPTPKLWHLLLLAHLISGNKSFTTVKAQMWCSLLDWGEGLLQCDRELKQNILRNAIFPGLKLWGRICDVSKKRHSTSSQQPNPHYLLPKLLPLLLLQETFNRSVQPQNPMNSQKLQQFLVT